MALLEVLTGHVPSGPLSALNGVRPAAATPPPNQSTVSSDSASALPSWLLIALFALVVLMVMAMFTVTAYNLTTTSRTLHRVTRRKKGENPLDVKTLSHSEFVGTLISSVQEGVRTTRTTLAVVGFSLLGVAVIAVFGLSGQGVRDLRNQVIGAVTTLVAAVAGFYFGARTAQSPSSDQGQNKRKPNPNNPPGDAATGQGQDSLKPDPEVAPV